jgi:hypothetical protein
MPRTAGDAYSPLKSVCFLWAGVTFAQQRSPEQNRAMMHGALARPDLAMSERIAGLMLRPGS